MHACVNLKGLFKNCHGRFTQMHRYVNNIARHIYNASHVLLPNVNSFLSFTCFLLSQTSTFLRLAHQVKKKNVYGTQQH